MANLASLIQSGLEQREDTDLALDELATLLDRIGDATGRRMVIPVQIWMLERVERVLRACTADAQGRAAIESLLGSFEGGRELLELGTLLAGCRIRKEGGRLFSVAG